MSGETVICQLCQSEKTINQVFSCLERGKKTYECVDEGMCYYTRKKSEDKRKKEIRKKYLENLDCNEEDMPNNEDIKGFTQEEQFGMKYKLNFADLRELPRFRDASVHYYHKEKDMYFTWSLVCKSWSISDDNIRKQFKVAD